MPFRAWFSSAHTHSQLSPSHTHTTHKRKKSSHLSFLSLNHSSNRTERTFSWWDLQAMNSPLGWLMQCGPSRLENKILQCTTPLPSNPCVQKNKMSAHSQFNLHILRNGYLLQRGATSPPHWGSSYQAPHSVFCTKILSFSFWIGTANSMPSLLQHCNNKTMRLIPFPYHIYLFFLPPLHATASYQLRQKKP